MYNYNMIYLTNAVKIPDEYRDYFGFLASSIHYRNADDELSSGVKWILDNDAFNGNFNIEKWILFMLKYKKFQNNCIGVTIPDIVGDAMETLRNFGYYYRIVKDLGYPVAFVTQDGITPAITPWSLFDTLFIGGTDEHKLNYEAGIMIAEAKKLNKWVHVGRVNSESRMKNFWMVDSVDGTQLSIIGKGTNGQSRNDRQSQDIKRLAIAVQYCRNKKSGKIKTNGQYIIEGI